MPKELIIDTSPPEAITSIGYSNNSQDIRADSLFDRIEQIKSIDDLEFRPTEFALATTIDFVKDLDPSLPIPTLMPDGEGGIALEWERGEGIDRRLARNIFHGTPDQRSYLYYRDNQGSAISYDLAPASVSSVLEKL